MNKWHWFQYLSCAVLALFFGLMLHVTFIAFTRRSGTNGMDMSKVQQRRQEALQHSFISENNGKK